MRLRSGVLVRVVALSCVILAACGAPPSAGDRSAGAPGERQAGAQAPKVLTWAIQQEPTDVTALSGLGGTRGPTSAFRQIAQAQLVKDDYTLSPFPELDVIRR